MSADVVELIGNPRAGSRTRAVADAATTAILASLGKAGVVLDGLEVLELADIVAVSFGPEPALPVRPAPDAHAVVRAARLLVVATPTYKGSYTGLLKIFLDRYGHQELAGIVAVGVGVAAGEAHRQAVGAALGQLLVELGATLPAPALTVLESSLATLDEVVSDWVGAYGPAIGDAFADPDRRATRAGGDEGHS
jgi:FMN reductase